MKIPEKPVDESARLQALHRLNLLDTADEERFDRITRQAQYEFQVPIALVSLVDKERQWFKSRRGLDATETPRNVSFCGHAIHGDGPLVVEDALEDLRFADNPLVVNDPKIRFYAGCPIRSPDGYRVGTLCLIDSVPRRFDNDQRRELSLLAQQVELELREYNKGQVIKAPAEPVRFGRFLSSRIGALLVSLAMFIGLLFPVFQSDSRYVDSIKLEREKAATTQLALLRGNIESDLNAKIYLVHGLTGIVQIDESLTQDRFHRFAEQLGNNIKGLKSLQLAPKGIVGYVWPLETNRAAIGHDLLADPSRRLAAQKAMKARSIWLAGPLNLIQGGQAIIARYPIFKEIEGEEAFWGFATLLLGVEDLINSAIPTSVLEKYQLAIRGVDGLGETGAVFYGNEELFTGVNLRNDIKLPAGNWQIAIRPIVGWSPSWQVRQARIGMLASGAALVSIILYFLLRIPARLRKSIHIATTNLERSESRFRDAVEALSDGFVVFDSAGNLALTNAIFQRLFTSSNSLPALGASFESLLARGVNDGTIRVPAGIDKSEFIAARSDDFFAVSSHFELLLADGRSIDVIFSSMRDGGRVGFFRDISEQKLNQAQLETEKFRAESASRAKSEFLATVSHEVRTPLNGVLSMLDMLSADELLSNDQRSMAITANDSAAHLLAILNDILDVSKIEAGKLDLDERPMNINAVVKGASDLVAHQAAEKGLSLTAKTDPELDNISVKGDAGRIRQVILNLLSNAVKFTDAGSVKVRTSKVALKGGSLSFNIAVEDTGIGFSEKDKETIFEAFSQIDSTADRKHEGTGLGLAICRKLVEAMGGEIAVTSERNVGTIFEVTLNLTIDDAVACVDETSLASGKLLTPASLGIENKKLLLVEDGLTNQIVVKAMLKETGYDIDLAENGIEAIAAVKAQTYDIVLMDIFMPEMDGVTATQEIRQIPGCKTLPIVALTANAMEGDRKRFEEAGMNDYLAKPVKRDDLLHTLSRYVLTEGFVAEDMPTH